MNLSFAGLNFAQQEAMTMSTNFYIFTNLLYNVLAHETLLYRSLLHEEMNVQYRFRNLDGLGDLRIAFLTTPLTLKRLPFWLTRRLNRSGMLFFTI